MAATANPPIMAGGPLLPDSLSTFPQYSSIIPIDGDFLMDETCDLGDIMSANLLDTAQPATLSPLQMVQQEDFAPAVVSQSTIQADLDSLRERSMSVTITGAGITPTLEDFPDPIFSAVNDAGRADLESYKNEQAATPEAQPMQAFAKLQFSDGDFYVNTYAVELGRDMDAMKHERRLKKMERRHRETGDGDGGVEDEGNHTDVGYAKLLEDARLMAGSNVSELGGIIGLTVLPGSEDEEKIARRRRKKALASNNSSHSQNQSIAPANLHANLDDSNVSTSILLEDSQTAATVSLECPFVPIHPSAGTSITGISRKHIRIEYNTEKAYWELHVLGRNGVFIDENRFVGMDEVVRLRHNTQILVQGIDITFKLPDNAREEEEYIDSDDEALRDELGQSDSELSESRSDIEMEERDSDATSSKDDGTPRERPKIKLSLSKRGQALSGKSKKKTAADAVTTVKTEKMDEVGKGPDEETAQQDVTQPTAPPVSEEEGVKPQPEVDADGNEIPIIPADLPPGSVLAGLLPEELPPKRKGPGRPPKNGVMSKRDEAIIKRIKKDIQKLGQEAPPLPELLAMARAEAGSTTTPKKPGESTGNDNEVTPMTSVAVMSTEATGESSALKTATTTEAEPPRQPTAAEVEAVKARKIARSPSPQKPESEYTEEELKKPQKTYVVLIHDALSACPGGVMDLQQIYDAIQKMYPYYRYRSQTQGWQSSIRHNLIGSEAFEEAGKIGKGRLWRINAKYPIDKEKKRRAQSPPTEKPAYPYYQNGQYPNQAYGPPYRPQYGSTYGPPSTLPNGARPPPSYGQQRNGAYFSPYANHPPGSAQPSPYSAQPRPPYTAPPNTTGGQPVPPAVQGINGSVKVPGQTPVAGITVQTGPNKRPNMPPPARTTNVQPPRPGTSQGQAPNGPAQPVATEEPDPTIEEIMAYHKKFLGGYKPGADQDAARDLFRKAVARHIEPTKTHGPYVSPEEETVAVNIGEIIQRNKALKREAQAKAQAKGPPPQVRTVAGSAVNNKMAAPQRITQPVQASQQVINGKQVVRPASQIGIAPTNTAPTLSTPSMANPNNTTIPPTTIDLTGSTPRPVPIPQAGVVVPRPPPSAVNNMAMQQSVIRPNPGNNIAQKPVAPASNIKASQQSPLAKGPMLAQSNNTLAAKATPAIMSASQRPLQAAFSPPNVTARPIQPAPPSRPNIAPTTRPFQTNGPTQTNAQSQGKAGPAKVNAPANIAPAIKPFALQGQMARPVGPPIQGVRPSDNLMSIPINPDIPKSSTQGNATTVNPLPVGQTAVVHPILSAAPTAMYPIATNAKAPTANMVVPKASESVISNTNDVIAGVKRPADDVVSTSLSAIPSGVSTSFANTPGEERGEPATKKVKEG